MNRLSHSNRAANMLMLIRVSRKVEADSFFSLLFVFMQNTLALLFSLVSFWFFALADLFLGLRRRPQRVGLTRLTSDSLMSPCRLSLEATSGRVEERRGRTRRGRRGSKQNGTAFRFILNLICTGRVAADTFDFNITCKSCFFSFNRKK